MGNFFSSDDHNLLDLHHFPSGQIVEIMAGSSHNAYILTKNDQHFHIKKYNLKAYEVTHSLQFSEHIVQCLLSKDEEFLVVLDSNFELRVIFTQELKEADQAHRIKLKKPAESKCFRAGLMDDDRTLLVISGFDVFKIDLATISIVKEYSSEIQTDIIDIKISPDQSKALFVSSDKQNIQIWDINKGETEAWFYAFEDPKSRICLLNDNKTFFTGRHEIEFWDYQTQKIVERIENANPFTHSDLKGLEDLIFKGCVIKDGKYFVTMLGSYIRVWNLQGEKKCVECIQKPSESFSEICLSQDEKYLLAGSNDKVMIWDFQAIIGNESDLKKRGRGFCV